MIAKSVSRAKGLTLSCCFSFLLLTTSAEAGIFYTVAPLGSGEWQFSYTVTPGNPTLAFDELTIYFDPALFSSVRSAEAPNGWDAVAIQPDPKIPDDGFYDALRLNGLFLPTSDLSGFRIIATYLAVGTPNSQPFDFIDSGSFKVLFSGVTIPAGSGAATVPEPTSLLLMLVGLSLLPWRGRTWAPRKIITPPRQAQIAVAITTDNLVPQRVGVRSTP